MANSTISEIISRADEELSNAVSNAIKCAWLSTLDTHIQRNVMLFPESALTASYKWPADRDRELVLSPEWNEVYIQLLKCRIHALRREQEEYMFCFEAYSRELLKFTQWYLNTYKPSESDEYGKRMAEAMG